MTTEERLKDILETTRQLKRQAAFINDRIAILESAAETIEMHVEALAEKENIDLYEAEF